LVAFMTSLQSQFYHIRHWCLKRQLSVCSPGLLVRVIWKCWIRNNVKNKMLFCYTDLQRHCECLKKRMVRSQWRKHRLTSGITLFAMAVRVSTAIRVAADLQLRYTTKTQSVCVILCEVTDERVFRMYSPYPLGMQWEGNVRKNGHETSGFFCTKTHLHIAIFPGLITAQLFPVSKTKKCSERTAKATRAQTNVS
jgi:hypothetical protein